MYNYWRTSNNAWTNSTASISPYVDYYPKQSENIKKKVKEKEPQTIFLFDPKNIVSDK
jgi:hypothetical protein